MSLAHFENRLTPGNIVSAVSINEDQAFESVLDEVLQQPSQQIQINSWWGGKGPGEIEMMMGIAQPLQRRADNSVAESFGNPAHNFAQQHTVSEQGQVMAMLFESGDREDNGSILAQRLQRGPSQVSELHGA